MKSRYFGLWMLLSLSLVVFLMFSFSDDDIGLGDWNIKKAPFKEALLKSPIVDSLLNDSIFITELSIENPLEVKTDSASKSIFLFGDSMTFNIALQMEKYARQNGHTFHAVNWDSSNTKIWAECDTLANYLKKYKADYVFISLGSNELYFKNPQTRLPYVKRILQVIDTIPYVWIGPPNWAEDTGINDMLETACRRGSFFRSAGMSFERKKDKIHPTRAASALWVDSIMRWMPHSSHPILAEAPSDSMGKVSTHVVFLKALNK